jgi:hypothetical protein
VRAICSDDAPAERAVGGFGPGDQALDSLGSCSTQTWGRRGNWASKPLLSQKAISYGAAYGQDGQVGLSGSVVAPATTLPSTRPPGAALWEACTAPLRVFACLKDLGFAFSDSKIGEVDFDFLSRIAAVSTGSSPDPVAPSLRKASGGYVGRAAHDNCRCGRR